MLTWRSFAVMYMILLACASYAFELYGDHLAVMIFTIIIIMHILVNILFGYYIIKSQAKVFGRPNQNEYGRLYKLLDNSDNPLPMANLTFQVLGIALIILSFVFSLNILWLGLWSLSIYFYNGAKLVRVPLILLLASSSDDKMKLYDVLKQAAYPHQVISLLKFTRDIPGHTSTRLHSLRGREDSNWLDRVEELMDLARIIVVDSRQSSSSIISESLLILNSRRLFKTVFIVGPKGEHPVIDAILINSPKHMKRKLVELGEADVSHLIRFIITEPVILPTRNKTMGDIIEDAPNRSYT